MLCPYNLRCETQVQRWQQNPDDNQTLTDGATITRTFYKYMECKQEDCGAFYNGRCYYNKPDSE